MSVDDFVPDLFAGYAAEVLHNSTCNVKHHVCPECDVAAPQETIMDAEWHELMTPFEQNRGFQKHDNDAIEDVVVVHILCSVRNIR